MRTFEKVPVRFKHVPEDFVVEEIGPGWPCVADWSAPQEILIPAKPDNKDYLCFEMVKRDIDHFIAVKTLSKQLKKSLKFISYAGSKDKKAITSQRVSIFQPDLSLVQNFSSEFIRLRNFRWEKRKIKLGYLEGNRFQVVLRDVVKKDAQKIAGIIRKRDWFANYFGPQRFGSVRKNNDVIGRLILKRKYQEAIMHILTDTAADEKPDILAARKRLKKERDFKAALGYFPQNLKLERGILTTLARKEDYLAALKRIEKRYSLMLVQAVQSRLFNDILVAALLEGVDFKEKGQQNIPLIGYKTKFSGGLLGEIEARILREHGLATEDFNLRDIPHLRLKGSYRRALITVQDLEVFVEDDELFTPSKKIMLRFTLPSGVYATTFLDEFFDFE